MPKLLTALKLSAPEFLDMCILMGCDYTGRIQQIGPARAHAFMCDHHSIEAIVEKVCDVQKPFVTPSKEAFDYASARRELGHWATLNIQNYHHIKLQEPDSEKLAYILKTFAAYVPSACASAVADWEAARQQYVSITTPLRAVCTLVERKGDLFDEANDATAALAHCVSQDLHMGAGIAVQFKQRYGSVDILKQLNPTVGNVIFLSREQRFVFYLVTKARYFHKPTYATLKNALLYLRDRCQTYGIKTLSMPRIGCGLDGLEWPRVKALLYTVFSDLAITITVYHL